jgi:acetyl-CoA acetyltransferase
MGIGPVPAVRNLTKRTSTKMEDYDAVELNEAFAAQVFACDCDLHFNRERLNTNGGPIALGHPIACMGSRILTTLIYELRRSLITAGDTAGREAGPRAGAGVLPHCVCPADWAWRSKSKRSNLLSGPFRGRQVWSDFDASTGA